MVTNTAHSPVRVYSDDTFPLNCFNIFHFGILAYCEILADDISHVLGEVGKHYPCVTGGETEARGEEMLSVLIWHCDSSKSKTQKQ